MIPSKITTTVLAAVGFFALSLTAFTGVADAHNWLDVGRTNPLGGIYASTELPCRRRRSTDTFAQVGPNQPFTFKWAANHRSDAYVIVVAGVNEVMLSHPNLSEYVREYLDDAKKEGQNLAQKEEYMRYRGGEGVIGGEQKFTTEYFKRKIEEDDPLYMTHPLKRTEEQEMWQYKDEDIASDLRANYANRKFPWLEAAAIYPSIYSSSANSEIVSIEISGHTEGPGHYVAHWLWNGYGDCTDFDFHATSISSDLVYGDVTAGWVFTRVDHCEFVGYTQVLSAPVEMNEDMTVDHCLDGLSGGEIGRDTLHTYGVNVVPAKLPSAAQRLATAQSIDPVHDGWEFCSLEMRKHIIVTDAFCKCDGKIRYGSKKSDEWSDTIVDLSDRIGLEWNVLEGGQDQLGHMCDERLFGNPASGDDKACYCKQRAPNKAAKPNIPWAHVPHGFESDWMTLTGAVSRSQEGAAYWEQWKTKTTVTAGLTCSGNTKLFESNLSLRDAVKKCDKDTRCTSLSWNNPANAEEVTALYTGKHKLRGCSGTEGDNDWTSLKRQFTDPGPVSGAEIKINFQPATLPDVEGWYTDSGEVFGSRNGEKYGWRCKTPNNFIKKTNKPGVVNSYTGLDGYAAYAMDVQMCNDGRQQVWELEVPNGVYEVTTAMAGRKAGCWVENVRQGFWNEGHYSHELTYQVSVEDGRLTAGGVSWQHSFKYCFDFTKLTAKKVFEGPPESWLPATKNPWIQMSLTEQTSVGVVKVTTGSLSEYPSRWLFQGNSRMPFEASACKVIGDVGCVDATRKPVSQDSYTTGILGRWDDLSKNGAVVGVSDTECTGDLCTPTTRCGVIDEQNSIAEHGKAKVDNYIDCKGATGKYLYVQLPGDQRILDFDLAVYRDEPVVNSKDNPTDEDTMVCYRVQAREATTVLPEYFTTSDPEDSMFYSTCFVRMPKIDWIATVNPLKTPRWKWHDKCLECDDYQNNELNFETLPEFTVPQWHMTDKCRNCDNLDL